MKKSYFLSTIIIIVGILFGTTFVINTNGQNKTVTLGAERSPKKVNADLQAANNAFIMVAKEATPAVVSVVVTTKAKKRSGGDMNDFFKFFPDFRFRVPEGGDEQTQGAGSGVIVTQDGYILTNNHVVQEAADDGIEVVLNDSRRFKAKLIGTDPLTDVGVIKIDAKNLPVAMLGNSDNVQVGEWAIAIGNPLGLSSTVTAGIVSYIGRQIGIIGDSYGVENFIQTDAAINPGNSGGALVNIYGEVIGINTAIATTNARYQGYGFAIPINLAKQVAQDLIAHGKVERGYIGVQIQTVDETIAKANGLEKAQGVMVQDLVDGGAGKSAGIKAGDIILSVDGKEVNTANQLQSYVATKHPGEKVTLQVWRDEKKIEKVVTLKARSNDKISVSNDEDNNSEESDNATTSTATFEKLGFTVKKSNAETKKELGDVTVTNVKMYSEAFNRGLRENTVIVEADKKAVSSVKDLEKIIQSKKAGDALMLRIKDANGASRFIAMQIPNE